MCNQLDKVTILLDWQAWGSRHHKKGRQLANAMHSMPYVRHPIIQLHPPEGKLVAWGRLMALSPRHLGTDLSGPNEHEEQRKQNRMEAKTAS